MSKETIGTLPSANPAARPVVVDHVGPASPAGEDYPIIKIDVGAIGSTVPLADTNAGRLPIGGSALGNPDDTSATTDSGTFGLIALFKRLLGKLPDRSKVSTTTPAQVTCDSTAASLLAQNTARKEAMLKNLGPYTAYLGKSSVTIATGYEVRVGETFVDDMTTQQWYGITLSGTTTFSVIEV